MRVSRALNAAAALSAALFLAGCKRDARSVREPAVTGPAGSLSLTAAFGTGAENAFDRPIWFGPIPGRAGAYAVAERGSGREDARVWTLFPRGGDYARKV